MSIAEPPPKPVPVAAALSPVVRGRELGRTSDQVFEALAAAIRDLRLPPGAPLSETDLAHQLEVSRTPVREAIARLVDGGLVQVVPQVGTKVARIRMADVHEARFVRESLEVAAFEEACGSTTLDCTLLHALLAEQEEAHQASDFDRFFIADEQFHMEIFRLSGFPGAWRAVQRMKPQLDRLRRLGLPEMSATGALIDEHRRIAVCLENRDLAGGRAHVSAHARRVLEAAPLLQSRHPDYFTA